MNKVKKSILLLGGGGHCKSVLCALLAGTEYTRIGVIDPMATEILGVAVVGTDDDIPRLHREYEAAFVTMGSLGNTRLRRRFWNLARENGYILPNIIDPTAIISPYATLGQGIFIGKGAVVNAGTVVGDCAILNTGSIVEHDDQIGAFAHIAPGAVLGGAVRIGEGSHIGSNAVVLQGVSVGPGSLVGAGSVVTKDLPGSVKAYGNPCREVSGI